MLAVIVLPAKHRPHRAASGHAATPPSSVMNSRRLMCSPQAEDNTLPQAVLCITAFWPARLPLRVSLGPKALSGLSPLLIQQLS